MQSIGSRIKRYESVSNYRLTPRSCLFIRVDGRAFHSYTKDANRPFDNGIIKSMNYAAKETAKEMQGFKLAYVQSDECTFMLTDFDTLSTQGWFDYKLNKVVSISASAFTAHFNHVRRGHGLALFDSRAFVVPRDDAPNVFVWRQKDWERNSLQMLARVTFSHKELDKKSSAEIHEMLHKRGINWANLQDVYKNGTFITPNYLLNSKLTYDEIKNILFGG